MNIMALLEILGEELNNASSLPLTTRKLVDADKCLDIISDLRINLPDDIKEAEIITAERKRIIAEAHQEADEILRRADEEAAERVSAHEITGIARQEAKAVMGEAQRDARDIKFGAMQYADEVLSELEQNVAVMLGEIRKNRQELRSREQGR